MTDKLEASGDLPLRIYGSYYWNDPEIDPIPMIEELVKENNTELVKARKIKVNIDGGDEHHTALFVDPYSDKPDVQVAPIIPYDTLNETVKRADAKGLDVFCHCHGDLAVRKMLDAIELAIEENPERDRHNVISHAMLIHPEDYGRFKELGVVVDLQAHWGTLDPFLVNVTKVRLGEERLNRYIAIKTMMDNDATVSISSDWPATTYFAAVEPLTIIQMAVTRRLPGQPEMEQLGGAEAMVPLADALRAYTLDSAAGIGIDNMVGSLEEGKLADLIVLDQNPFDVAPEDISKINVLYTVMNGRLVHEARVE
ncbi:MULTISPECIES: amidohydrolase [unclassified Ruegeria]|uniref:amidohydrolase n=1 Tax=unclassified Ruegeria TaxID=2625375 RepID=UPI0014883FA6|nr:MULTISPECIES: amidohydrolase family protein [unclassified Ruegeria]